LFLEKGRKIFTAAYFCDPFSKLQTDTAKFSYIFEPKLPSEANFFVKIKLWVLCAKYF